jgi:hypothetical protein
MKLRLYSSPKAPISPSKHAWVDTGTNCYSVPSSRSSRNSAPSDDTLEVITTSKGRRKSQSGPRMTLGNAARARLRLIFRPTGIFVEAPFIAPTSKASSSGAARLHR